MNIFELSQYSFMQNAFIAGTIIAVLSGIIGYFVILKQLSFTAHALSHIGFAGACGAGLIGFSLLSGQLWLTLLAAISIVLLGDRIEKNDPAIGIILAFALGLGSLFLYLNNHFAGSASRILFGDLFSISAESVRQIEYLSVICTLMICFIARPLWFSALLPELALAQGLPVHLLHFIFFIILAVTITLVSQAVGILLIFTLLIGPPAIAIRYTQQFWRSILLCILLNILAIWSGLIASALSNWPLSFWMSSLVLVAYAVTYLIKKN